MAEHQVDPEVIRIIEDTFRDAREAPASAACEQILLRLWEGGYEVRPRTEQQSG